MKQRFCFVTIVTKVQTVLYIKGRHDAIKFSLLISPKSKTKYGKHFGSEGKKHISVS